MKEYIDKELFIKKVKEKIKDIYASREYVGIPSEEEKIIDGFNQAIEIINTLETKEINDVEIPKHSYFDSIYHVGSEPIWKIGDILAMYEFCEAYEREYVYGEIIDIKMDEEYNDWLYSFKGGEEIEEIYEKELIGEEAYKI
jgi:hypothetical protein